MADEPARRPRRAARRPVAGPDDVAYPRADPADFDRLPIDTWAMAGSPRRRPPRAASTTASRRSRSTTRRPPTTSATAATGAGTTFALWPGDARWSPPGRRSVTHTVRLDLPAGRGASSCTCPRGCGPRLHAVRDRGRMRRRRLPPGPDGCATATRSPRAGWPPSRRARGR